MSGYRATITTHYPGVDLPRVVDACQHEHAKPGPAAKCAAVIVRSILNAPGFDLPLAICYRVESR